MTTYANNIQGNLPPPCGFNDFPMVSTLIDNEIRKWKIELIRTLFLPFEANTILNIPLSHNLPEDKVIWVGNCNGVFTVKNAYYIALGVIEYEDNGESSNGDPKAPLWRKLWHLKILAKMKIFA